MAKKRVIHTLEVSGLGMLGSVGRRVECYRLGNWVCMTGQVGINMETGELIGPGDPGAQARQACENIKVMMEMAGGAMADVVKMTVYITDRSYRADAYPVIRSFFGNPRPCQTGVVVKGLAREDFLIEIDAWGFIDDPE